MVTRKSTKSSAYDIDPGRRGIVARFDRDLITSGRTGFITQDEESSGIIAADQQLGNGWFLFDALVHAPAANPEHALRFRATARRRRERLRRRSNSTAWPAVRLRAVTPSRA